MGTVYLGCLLVILAWIESLAVRVAYSNWRIPTALYTFTASTCLVLIGLAILSKIPYEMHERAIHGMQLPQCVWSALLVGSFVLVIASLVLSRRDSGPGLIIVRAGCAILIVLDVVSFIALDGGFLGLPLG